MELIKFDNGWMARDGSGIVIPEIANWAATQQLKDTGIEYLAPSEMLDTVVEYPLNIVLSWMRIEY